MIQLHDLTGYFRPSFERDYKFGKKHINVQVQYHGPVPEFNRPTLETFMFSIYQGGARVLTGSIEWNSENGPLTVEEAAKAIVIYWGTDYAG